MITFIKKIISGQKKLYLGILAVLSLLSSFEFISVVMYSTSNIEVDFANGYILQLVTGIVIMIAFALTLFVNNYIINNKNEEFSLLLLCGRNMKQIIRYILIQFGLLFLISYALGFLIGWGWVYMYSAIYDAVITVDLTNILIIYGALFLTKMIYVVVIDMGKFMRIKTDIAGYMNHVPRKTTNFNPFKLMSSGLALKGEKPKTIDMLPKGKILSTILGILLIYIGFTPMLRSIENNNLPTYFAFSFLGEVLIIDNTFPLLFDLLHNKVLLKSKNWIISLSNLKDLTDVMTAMINISAVVVPIIISFLFLQSVSIDVQNAMMMSFFALMASMFLCFIIRFMIYLPTRASVIATMRALGYNKKSIFKIHYQEMMLFIILIVIFPIVMYGSLLYQSYLVNMITYNTFITMIAIYIILYTFMSIYMIVSYRKLIKEVYDDVRYLNHGE